MPEEQTGTVAEIIYTSEDGYTVAEIDAPEPFVAVGNMHGLTVGEQARFFGEFKTHPRFGRQFSVSSYHSMLPSDLNDMALFLGGGFIKGLGEVLAGRIVEQFGEDTFRIIETDPALLAEVKGVSRKLAQSISAAFKEYSREKYTYSELMGMGLTARQATAAATKLGGGAAGMIRKNPYILISEIRGIDFITADRIARNLGVEKNSPFRIKNGIMNVLNKLLQNGDMYVIKSRLLPHVAQHLGVDAEEVSRCLLSMTQEGETVMRSYAEDFTVVASRRSYEAELKAASKLFTMAYSTKETAIAGLDGLIEKQRAAFSLSDEQAEAVRAAAESRVCVITGGPGTGKTTILKAVLNIMGAAGFSCAMAAPTGRAAKRMQEATGEEAKTLHRLLEYAYDEDAFQCYFRKNEEDPLTADVVIVDEVSMLDIFLFGNLLRAVKPGSRLLLVGDADQLPSVGPGNVMRDILSSGAVRQVCLTYRFRNEGRIADAAYEILNGRAPQPDEEEFQFVECKSRAQTVDRVLEEYLRYAEQGADVQVIAPIKRTETGTVSLNLLIRDTVNPARKGKAEIAFGDRVFREGDRVMQIVNNYCKPWRDNERLMEGEGVFNGDIGIIAQIRAGLTTVRFEDGKCCDYEIMELAELDGAFAYTIHKSQGGEFDVVIIPMKYDPNPFFTRNLLYTGVTRAKRRVIIIGDGYTMDYMLKNGSTGRRSTALAKELRYFSNLVGGRFVDGYL